MLVICVFYTSTILLSKDNIMPLTREEVWHGIKQLELCVWYKFHIFECKDVVVLGPSENITKDSHYSSMRQQYMYMIYLYQGDTPVSFTSHPTPSLKYPRTTIPLVIQIVSIPVIVLMIKTWNFLYCLWYLLTSHFFFQCIICVDGDEVSSTIFDVKCQLLQVNCLYFIS